MIEDHDPRSWIGLLNDQLTRRLNRQIGDVEMKKKKKKKKKGNFVIQAFIYTFYEKSFISMETRCFCVITN